MVSWSYSTPTTGEYFIVTMIFMPLPRALIEAGDALSVLVFILLGLLIGLSWWTTSPQLPEKSAHVDDDEDYLQRDPKASEEKRNQVSWSLAHSLFGSLYRFAVGLRLMVYSVSFQFFTVLGLTLFGTDKTSAAGFSLVVFVLLSTHIWVLGFWAFRRSGLTFFGMETELNRSSPGSQIDS